MNYLQTLLGLAHNAENAVSNVAHAVQGSHASGPIVDVFKQITPQPFQPIQQVALRPQVRTAGYASQSAGLAPWSVATQAQGLHITPQQYSSGIPGLNGVPAPSAGLTMDGNGQGGFLPAGTGVVDGSAFPMSPHQFPTYQPMQQLPRLPQIPAQGQ